MSDGADGVVVRALSPNELARLVEETAPEWRLLIRFIAYTGLRIGEVLALRWGDVDLAERRIRVRRRLYRDTYDKPKSAYGRRDVPISATLAADLEERRRSGLNARDRDLVWSTRNGTPHKRENLSRRVLKPAAERADISWAGFHTLRHTCATMLFRGGATPKQVQIVLGHHSPGFTLATYVHLLPDDLPDPSLLDAVVPA